MAVIITKEALMNQAYHVQEDEADYTLRLYKNDLTPDVDTEFGDLTEADFNGYSEDFPLIDSIAWDAIDECAVATFNEKTWTKGAGGTSNTIYGWFMVEPNHDGGGGKKLVMVRRFPSPLLMDTTGSLIILTAILKFFPHA